MFCRLLCVGRGNFTVYVDVSDCGAMVRNTSFITFGIEIGRKSIDTDLLTNCAMAASLGCSNRSMRKSGRSTWNQDDYKVAAKGMYERIYKA